MNIQGLIMLKRSLNKPCLEKKKNHCFILPSFSRPSGAENAFAFSSFVGFQPEPLLVGNWSSRRGDPALDPPPPQEAWSLAARCASQRDGRGEPGRSGWGQLSLERLVCHPRKQIPGVGCVPTGPVLAPVGLLLGLVTVL